MPDTCPSRLCQLFFSVIVSALTVTTCHSQSPLPPTNYPTHLPYAFSNFVWWSDFDLRSQLKKRIPGLADEIAPTHAVESRLRDALIFLLKQKGITADVISEEPSPSSLTAERVPGAPGPAIVFSILNPQIFVGQTTVNSAAESVDSSLTELLSREHGREYSSWQDWSTRYDAEQKLQQAGYFDAHTQITHDEPRREGDHYVINLALSITLGPQYHIGQIVGDGGPLLHGQDLSSAFKVKPGDVATGSPWGNLGGQLRALYADYGYADVIVDGDPVIDHEHALVSYHLSVTPGPLYHLRSLTILSLDSGQESKVRRLFPLHPGDPFDEAAISTLYRYLRADSTLSGYTFTFSPKKDKDNGMVDLTLDFSRDKDQPRVTVH